MAGTSTAMSPTSPTADARQAAEPSRACGADGDCANLALSCRWTRLTLLGTCLALTLAVDQASKIYAMQHLRATQVEPLSFARGLFRVQYAENPGAFLSLLGTFDPAVRFWVLTVANGVILLGLGMYLVVGRRIDLWSWTALAMILSGGVGNLIDRIRFEGRVIDFLILSSGPLSLPGLGEVRTGIFNVADVAITAGFLMLLPRVFLPERAAQEGCAKSVISP